MPKMRWQITSEASAFPALPLLEEFHARLGIMCGVSPEGLHACMHAGIMSGICQQQGPAAEMSRWPSSSTWKKIIFREGFGCQPGRLACSTHASCWGAADSGPSRGMRQRCHPGLLPRLEEALYGGLQPTTSRNTACTSTRETHFCSACTSFEQSLLSFDSVGVQLSIPVHQLMQHRSCKDLLCACLACVALGGSLATAISNSGRR